MTPQLWRSPRGILATATEPAANHADRYRPRATVAAVSNVLPFPSNGRRDEPEQEPEPRLRTVIGDVIRDERRTQERTLAEVAVDAAVSLPYLSEVERGRKAVSSDVLGAICDALDLPLADVLDRSAERLRIDARAQRGSGFQLLAA